MKKIIIIFIVLIITAFSVIIILNQKKETVTSSKVKIVTTIFPSYDSVQQIAGDKVDLLQLLPPGTEAHSFEPKPSDLVKINEADIFIYTGKEMEPWVNDILQSISNKNLLIINISSEIPMMASPIHEGEEEHGLDPHIWLDFDNYQKINNQIARALITKDAANKNFYETNLSLYNQKISLLNSKYQEGLKNCENHQIIYGGHYAFGYMAKKYNFSYESAQGFSPDSEPSAQDLISLVKQIKNNNIKYVYYEEMSSPKIADTLSKETGTQLLLLNAAHNVSKEQIENKISFIDIMENNLNNLKLGLNCK